MHRLTTSLLTVFIAVVLWLTPAPTMACPVPVPPALPARARAVDGAPPH